MSMSNAFRQIREAAARRDHRSNWVPANIGAVVEGANTIPSPRGGAWVYVTLTKGDENGAVSEALCHKITPAWNCPVSLSVNKQGFYIVEEVDPARYDMWTSGNDGGVLGSHNVAPHHHDDDTSPLGQDFVSNRRLKDGRVEWRNGDDGAYTVYIHAFAYADINGADTYWPGGTLDLSGYLTVTTDEWQWIKVGMDRTNLVPTAIAGTATPIGVPLNVGDLATVSFSPNLPLAGVLITFNQAIQSQDDITDCSFVKSPGTNATILSDAIIIAPNSATRNTITPTATTYPNLILKAIASQTADFLQFLSSAGVTLAKVTAAGLAQFASLIVGGTSLDASAIAQIDSTTKGFAAPRMTTTQRDAISSPLEGLMIYNTTTHEYEQRTNSAWVAMGGAAGVTSVDTGTGLSGGPITGTGTIISTPVFKQPARVVATSNVTISSPGASIDGVSLASGERVLLTAQSTGSQNGLWVWNGAASAMTRPTDFAAASTVLAFFNIFVYIYAGTTNNIGSLWRLTTTATVTIDTTSQAWSRVDINLSAAQGILAEANGGTGRATGAATKALDNLASVAINTAPLPASDLGIDFGSATKRWANGYIQVIIGDSIAQRVKNTSGATANAGDVGYIDYDSTYGYVYKTTTTAQDTKTWCAVLVGAANNSDIYVATSGVVTVNYTGTAPSAGHWLVTSTGAGLAQRQTTMHYAIFAVCLAGGSGGTVLVRLLARSSNIYLTDTNYFFQCYAASTSNFVSTINGAPSATSVVFGAVTSGAANVLDPSASTNLAKAVLWNSTRSSGRLITAVNVGTSTITTVSSTDSWANGDTITIVSQTVTSPRSDKYIELDLTQQTSIPLLSRAVLLWTAQLDTNAASGFSSWHPYETYSASKQKTIVDVSTSIYNRVEGVATNLVAQRLTYSISAAASGSGNIFTQLTGYVLATP